VRDANTRWIQDLRLPYDSQQKELSEDPRIVDGLNVCIYGGQIRPRPGVVASSLPSLTGRRIDRMAALVRYDERKFLVVSAYNPSTNAWEVWYIEPAAASPVWAQIDNLRNIHNSTRPHEFLVANGRVFIKGFNPSSASTVQFDGERTDYWGLDKPTQPARRTNPSTWAASGSPVQVLFGWKYAYSWKSRTGHVSCRSPLEFNPANQPSDTGPFTNKIPVITVRGHADTTRIPKIIIWRTRDGGGTFLKLAEIDNTGDTNITYADNSLTGNDPKPDASLDAFDISPTEISNEPPPGNTPNVPTGTPSTNLAYFARRIWYAISNRLFFSGYEEIINGVKEESFFGPNNVLGNYFFLRQPAKALVPARDFLYILTPDEILGLSGESRNQFTVKLLNTGLGGSNYPHAATSWGNSLIFLANDGQIYAFEPGGFPQIASFPLKDQIRNLTYHDAIFLTFSRGGVNWLTCWFFNRYTGQATVYTFDPAANIWFPPWTINATAACWGQVFSAQRDLVIASGGTIYYLSLDAQQDASGPFSWHFTLNPLGVPAGYQLNEVNRPGRVFRISYVLLEKDPVSNPTVQYLVNEISGSFKTATPTDPPYLYPTTTTKQVWYPIEELAYRVKLRVSGSGPFALDSIGLVFRSTET